MECFVFDTEETRYIDEDIIQEIENIACILYYNSKIKNTKLDLDSALGVSEAVIFQTVHRLNDKSIAMTYLFLRFIKASNCEIVTYNNATKSYDVVNELLEDENFNWSRRMLIEAPSTAGSLKYFDFVVVACGTEGKILIHVEMRNGSGSSSALFRENPLEITEQNFGSYYRRLWSQFESHFFAPIFNRAMEDKVILWSQNHSESNSV